MAESTFPNPAVTQRQHELLMGRALPSGVIGHPDDLPVVYAPGSGTREIRIRADRQAVVEGYGWQNDAVELVRTLTANTSGSTRVDLVVLRLDRATYGVTVEILPGTPGAGAPSPTYNTGSSGVWELPLATVTVADGATVLAGSTVTSVAWYLGDDGQILAKSTNLTWLPHAPFRLAGLTDTSRVVMSDGTSWNTVIDDSGATSAQMLTGYAATENTLRRRNGVCLLNIKVQRTNGSIPAGSTTKVANLPAGFAPAVPAQSAAMYWSTGQIAGLRVTASGVYVVTPAGVTIAEDRTVDGQLVWFAA